MMSLQSHNNVGSGSNPTERVLCFHLLNYNHRIVFLNHSKSWLNVEC